MKIKKADFEEMKKAIDKVLSNNPNIVTDYSAGRFARADKVKDLQTRFNFDLLRYSGFKTTALYSYLNDNHIATALRNICPQVPRNY